MAVKKFAISIPEDVMEEVDRAAAERRTTRSAFIASVLRRVARSRSDAEITRRIDEVFADPAVAREQKETAARYRTLGPRKGTQW